ncbi:MAG: HAMP domain-containing sensor histidine kinase [Candidatus Zixiibacteriota bacterium]
MKLGSLSPRTALVIFLVLVAFVLAMAAWWIIFMARLTDEKVDMAAQLGASAEYVEELHQQEIRRQIMLGSEGVVFLLLVLIGVWLIYRSLLQADRLRTRQENFLMAVTHELKTPLASIGIYIDTLQSDKIPAVRKQAVIPRIKQDLRRLERLVEDILEAGRFETGEFKLNLQSVDLAKLLNSAADSLADRGEPTSPRISRHIEPGVIVQADAPVVTRAIAAILDNTVKYSGGAAADVTITLRRNQRQAIITVTDKGVGIAKQELGPIFERFYRVGHEMTRASRGTGLGLYLCREMIRAHGGEVTARSEGPGLGSEFIITLPLERVK